MKLDSGTDQIRWPFKSVRSFFPAVVVGGAVICYPVLVPNSRAFRSPLDPAFRAEW